MYLLYMFVYYIYMFQHTVYCPEVLMRNVLAQIHYMPDHWAGNAHTAKVRGEFSLLFQFKAVSFI